MHWWQDTRKSALFTMWGMAKATDTPLSLGKLRSPENGRKVKGVAFWGDNGQEIVIWGIVE